MTDLITSLSIIPVNQLSSDNDSYLILQILSLTQKYRKNPRKMNAIPIPVIDITPPAPPIPTVAIKRCYKILANHHIFFARQRAQCPSALCLQLNHPEQHMDVLKTELQIQPAKLNIAAMNQEELQQAFAYLIKKEKVVAKLLNHREMVRALAEHPGRPYWSSWEPLKTLAKARKVSITKRHTDCLDNYFCFDPQPLPSLCINTIPAEDLSRHLHILSLETGSVDQLSQWLSDSPSRLYWRDSKDMAKALRDEAQFTIPKARQTILAKGFHFTPAPPPVPNTVPFLLQQMTVKELRWEADERGLVHKGMKKADLVRLLSSG